jgi:hypothetical protein
VARPPMKLRPLPNPKSNWFLKPAGYVSKNKRDF